MLLDLEGMSRVEQIRLDRCTDAPNDLCALEADDRWQLEHVAAQCQAEDLRGNQPGPSRRYGPLLNALRADLVWDGTGIGNCWQGNAYPTAIPPTLPACGRRGNSSRTSGEPWVVSVASGRTLKASELTGPEDGPV